jgi:anti-sigma B factor antagonist
MAVKRRVKSGTFLLVRNLYTPELPAVSWAAPFTVRATTVARAAFRGALAGLEMKGDAAMDSSSNSFSATLESLNGSAVVVLVGELDLNTAPVLEGTLDPLLDDGPPEVVIECSGLEFIDSSGIAILVRAQQRLQIRGGHLVVRSLKPHALKIFETVGLIDYLGVETEVADRQIS